MDVLPAWAVVTVPPVTKAVAENFMNVRLSKLAIGAVLSGDAAKLYDARAAFTEGADLTMYCSQSVDNRLRPHVRL
ncbi:hypothetical protein [Rhizobium herbae]